MKKNFLQMNNCVSCGDKHEDTLGDGVCCDCRDPDDFKKTSKDRGHLTYCDKHGYKNILDIALAVKMYANGSAEENIQRTSQDVKCLKYILDTWKESRNEEEERFDDAVKDVVKAALEQFSHSFLTRMVENFEHHECKSSEYSKNKCIHCGKFMKDTSMRRNTNA